MSFLDQRAGLTGRVAVVVGGGGGIGAAVSLALAGAGVDLAVCDVNQSAMEETRRAACGLGRRVYAEGVDVTDSTQLDRFYASAPGAGS